VTLVDVTRVARDVYANHLLPLEAFGMAAVIYFGLTFTLVGGFRLLERHGLRHLRVERRPDAAIDPAPPRTA
jgi:arginine/ornithine transport system permease protein